MSDATAKLERRIVLIAMRYFKQAKRGFTFPGERGLCSVYREQLLRACAQLKAIKR